MLEDAATFLDLKTFGPVQGRLRCAEFDHWSAVQETLLFYREHWDAPGGTPGSLSGELIPQTSRILAVADVWARLTAAISVDGMRFGAMGSLVRSQRFTWRTSSKVSSVFLM